MEIDSYLLFLVSVKKEIGYWTQTRRRKETDQNVEPFYFRNR